MLVAIIIAGRVKEDNNNREAEVEMEVGASRAGVRGSSETIKV